MKTTVLSLISLGLLLFMASCGKEYIGEFDENYNGEWHSDTLTLTDTGEDVEIYMIINGQYAEYGFLCKVNCTACECTFLTTGKAKINKDHTKLYFGLGYGNNSTSVKITEPPHVNAAGQWECKIEDHRMLRL
jgi:hypothetical protein